MRKDDNNLKNGKLMWNYKNENRIMIIFVNCKKGNYNKGKHTARNLQSILVSLPD